MGQCPKVDCDDPVQVPGKCCKVCPGKQGKCQIIHFNTILQGCCIFAFPSLPGAERYFVIDSKCLPLVSSSPSSIVRDTKPTKRTIQLKRSKTFFFLAKQLFQLSSNPLKFNVIRLMSDFYCTYFALQSHSVLTVSIPKKTHMTC